MKRCDFKLHLQQHYLMATLTNRDRIGYMGSNARLEMELDGLYTAQDAGSYKPALRNVDGLGATLPPDAPYHIDRKFPSMTALVAAHREEFAHSQDILRPHFI